MPVDPGMGPCHAVTDPSCPTICCVTAGTAAASIIFYAPQICMPPNTASADAARVSWELSRTSSTKRSPPTNACRLHCHWHTGDAASGSPRSPKRLFAQLHCAFNTDGHQILSCLIMPASQIPPHAKQPLTTYAPFWARTTRRASACATWL